MSKKLYFESIPLHQSHKSERGCTKDKNKMAHRTRESPGVWRQNWNWDVTRSIPHVYLQKLERSTLIQKGPGNFSPGTPPVIFFFWHIHVDYLQALTDSGPIYRRIYKTERHKWSLNTQNSLAGWRLYSTVVLVGLGDPGRAPKCYAQITKSPQNKQGDWILYVKEKSLYSYTSLQTWSLVCPRYWSDWRALSSVRVRFTP